MNAHTPGLCSGLPIITADQHNTEVCGVVGNVADAHLIAAAPELLAACEAVAFFSGFVGGFVSRPSWWKDDAAWKAWVEASEQTRAAIAQARGRA